ncbi:unnamed protein product [Notodromas monacha]|uniref:Solute carrier family 25 member 35 n=1 Tax=Notodromas monacha TaxID=399045 RepID=A0A7R9GAX2_9CRUS|nr:unnamed protein product [Notodromas monacha]CAG0914183.1 unnamed protein product [Notodromas monacha]
MLEFVLGGVAACGACVFTNPLEVVKIRLQLQGELRAKGLYQVHYKNVFQGLLAVARADGMKALQKGLIPAMWYQLVMNGFRLGSYQSMVNAGLVHGEAGQISLPHSVAAGAAAGAVGAVFASPFFLVKTHLQSKADTSVAVGHQHDADKMLQAARKIYSGQGVVGLWRGVGGAVPRVMVGSAAQLSTFSKAMEAVRGIEGLPKKSWVLALMASFMSGLVVVVCFTPFDVISTRLYNQGVDARGKGLMYEGILDCARKIMHSEGFFGLYKGWTANYLRVGPHTVLSLVFWNELSIVFDRVVFVLVVHVSEYPGRGVQSAVRY